MASHYMQWYVLLSLGRVTPLHCFDMGCMHLNYICSICVLKCIAIYPLQYLAHHHKIGRCMHAWCT